MVPRSYRRGARRGEEIGTRRPQERGKGEGGFPPPVRPPPPPPCRAAGRLAAARVVGELVQARRLQADVPPPPAGPQQFSVGRAGERTGSRVGRAALLGGAPPLARRGLGARLPGPRGGPAARCGWPRGGHTRRARRDLITQTRGPPPRARIHADRCGAGAVVARPRPRFGPSTVCGVVSLGHVRAWAQRETDWSQAGPRAISAAAVWLGHLPSPPPRGVPRTGGGGGRERTTPASTRVHDAGSDWSLAVPRLLQCQRAHGPRRRRSRREGPPLPLPCPRCTGAARLALLRSAPRRHTRPCRWLRMGIPQWVPAQAPHWQGVLVTGSRDDHE